MSLNIIIIIIAFITIIIFIIIIITSFNSLIPNRPLNKSVNKQMWT